MCLPITCTMRCTDIWRSLVALRIMSLNNKNILFFGSTMIQNRNDHNLINDFIDEILSTTPRKIKVIFNGEFTITNTININHINWDIRILGNSNTIIKYSDISTDLIVVTSCRRFEIRDLELNTCRYGLRTYASTEEIIVHNITNIS